MLYFFYGPDTYSSTKKVREIEHDFVSGQGSDLNLNKIEGENLTSEKFYSEAMSLPFLGDKRLIIIKNLLSRNADKDLKQKIVQSLDKIPGQNSVIFWEEEKFDRREAIFKTLLKKADSKEYLLQETRTLSDWIINKAKTFGGEIERPAAIKLAIAVGPDLWRLENEISKLALWSQSQNARINSEDVENQVESINNFQIFDLTDAVAARNLIKSLAIYLNFQKEGVDSLMVINMIIYQYRNMLIINDLLEKGSIVGSLAAKTKIHPYVVSKIATFLRTYDPSQLRQNYVLLAETDWLIKSGGIDPEIAVFKLLVDFCKR